MKKLAFAAIVLVLSVGTALAGTNSSPVSAIKTVKSPPSKKIPAEGAKSPNVVASIPAPSANEGTLSHQAALTPAQMSLFRHIDEEGLLQPTRARNYNGALRSIFHPWSDPGGPTEIRDTVATIYPPGR